METQMANRSHITFDQGRKIEVGKTYTGKNGAVFTVESIFTGDRYLQDGVSYRLEDGRPGTTPPNSMYYWIWGA